MKHIEFAQPNSYYLFCIWVSFLFDEEMKASFVTKGFYLFSYIIFCTHFSIYQSLHSDSTTNYVSTTQRNVKC
jgi:hypothetical protein